MPPGHPYNPAPPLGPEQYDFILRYGNHNHGGTPGGSTPTARIAIVVIGGLVLLTAAVIFMKILSKPANPTAGTLVRIAQQQTELARVAGLAPNAAGAAQPTLDFAITTQLSIQSDRQTLLDLIKKEGQPVPADKVLQAAQSSKTDSTLQAAQANGNYDQTFMTATQGQLAQYEQTLKQAYASSQQKAEKDLLQAAYDHAALLAQFSQQNE